MGAVRGRAPVAIDIDRVAVSYVGVDRNVLASTVYASKHNDANQYGDWVELVRFISDKQQTVKFDFYLTADNSERASSNDTVIDVEYRGRLLNADATNTEKSVIISPIQKPFDEANGTLDRKNFIPLPVPVELLENEVVVIEARVATN